MKRRTFFRQAGVLLAGTTATTALPEETPGNEKWMANGHSPIVLLTAPGSDLGSALADGLRARFHIRPAEAPLFQDSTGRLEQLLDGVNAVVVAPEPAAMEPGEERLDQRSRGTYNLLCAAAAKGVQLVVYLSSLQIMAGYPRTFQVSEDWRPVPTTDPEQLSHYLAEFTCREFAREGKLRVVVLRLGEIVPSEALPNRPCDPICVAQDDVVQAVRLTLEAHFRPETAVQQAWSVLHIAVDVPGGRLPVHRAKRVLGYQPRSIPSS